MCLFCRDDAMREVGSLTPPSLPSLPPSLPPSSHFRQAVPRPLCVYVWSDWFHCGLYAGGAVVVGTVDRLGREGGREGGEGGWEGGRMLCGGFIRSWRG